MTEPYDPAQKETETTQQNKPFSKATIDLSKLTDFEISVLILERDVAQYRIERIDELLNKVGETKGFAENITTEEKPAPQLDPDDLAGLPWKTYKTKEPAKPDEAGWIFRNIKGAEALADLIEKQGKGTHVLIGSQKFEFSFSGADRQFIGRKPSKTSS
jgi:hypothetical protein